MPIHNLTNPAKQFIQLGNIRKGEMQATKGDPSKKKPVDLTYFRVTYKAGANAAALEAEFKRCYQDQPRAIDIRLPFETVAECWDANYECYKQGGMVCKAGVSDTGPYWIFYRDPNDNEILVRDGQPVGERGRKFFDKPFNVEDPIYFNAKKEPVLMEPVGRLQAVIPQLAPLGVGYFLFQATSPRDIRNLSAELGVYEQIAKQYGGKITGMPLRLIRREEEVSKKIDGKLSKGPSWVVHIELAGEFSKLALEAIDRLALPDLVDGEVTEGDVAEEEFGPMVTTAKQLAAKNEPIVVATGMSYEDASKVIVKQQGKEKFMSELGNKELNWLILNSKDPKVVEAAKVVILGEPS